MPGNDLSAALARTLAALRAERGWSLDQLAARSGVSKGVLVSLEQARSNPNLATLARVGDAFGLPVTRLLDGPPEPSVRITGPEYARTLWHGAVGRIRDHHRRDRAALGRRAVALGGAPRRVVRRGRARARDQGTRLGRGRHPDADRGRGAAPGRPRRSVPASPGACRTPTPTRGPARSASPWSWWSPRPRREHAPMATARHAVGAPDRSDQSAGLVR